MKVMINEKCKGGHRVLSTVDNPSKILRAASVIHRVIKFSLTNHKLLNLKNIWQGCFIFLDKVVPKIDTSVVRNVKIEELNKVNTEKRCHVFL